jgi:hypothetical protein
MENSYMSVLRQNYKQILVSFIKQNSVPKVI